MAEMTTLAAAIYRKYHTTLAPGFEDITPGITARFEVFYDDRFPKMLVRHFHSDLHETWLETDDPCRSILASSNSRNWRVMLEVVKGSAGCKWV